MGLYVSTTGTNVTIAELGIILVHPTTNKDLTAQFSDDELSKAPSLTAAIRSGLLTWKKTSGGAAESPTDYDEDWAEVEALNTGSGASGDRIVKFSDLPPGATFGNPVGLVPDGGNQQGSATTTSRSDHQHDVPTAAPPSDLTGASTNAAGTALSFSRSDHSHKVALATTDLTDVIETSPKIDDVLRFDGTVWRNAPAVVTGVGVTGSNFFLATQASGIGGYDYMFNYPDTNAEVQESVVVTSGTSPLLIDQYVSASPLNTTTIPAGIWTLNLYTYVSQANPSHISHIEVHFYSRTAGGTETLLFSANTLDIVETISAALYQTKIAQPAFTVNTTDYLVAKIYAVTSDGPVTVYLIHSGESHNSYFQTPLVGLHNDLGGLQGGNSTERYHLTQNQVSKLDGIKYKSGTILPAAWSGNPKTATVTFVTPFSTTNYNVNITGSDSRIWSIDVRNVGSFVVSANANQPISGNVYWQAELDGEVD